jgi:transketolase
MQSNLEKTEEQRVRHVDSRSLARQMRIHALHMVYDAKASHIGTCLSVADILAVLYYDVMRLNISSPQMPERDRLILSKGHGAAILYAALAERGFFPVSWLKNYCKNGSPLTGHINHAGVPGVEVSTGSLGHGLSIGCGMALGLRADDKGARVFVVMSDGECDEGSIWEAALFAPFHKLHNLTAIIDYNKIQSFGIVKDVLDLEPFADKWRAFGWHVVEVDGHDHVALRQAMMIVHEEKPTLILAHTVKGKGVSFMENDLAWHYRSPDAELLARALAEIVE